MRVYELSKKMGVKSQEILAFAQDLNLSSTSQLANLNDNQIAFIKDKLKNNHTKDRMGHSSKLIRNPYSFFEDSKIPLIKGFKVLFKKK
ncbi:MAG: translation initiation factor IF-2 N-terminal domain-containing protein [Coraliomargaritaceae bacterium]